MKSSGLAGCWGVALLCVFVGGWFDLREVNACSCVFSLTRDVSPADGSRDLPVNARIFVFLEGGFTEEDVEAAGDEYRLRGPGGKMVPLRRERLLNRVTLIPAGGLRAGKRYVLEQRFWRVPGGRLPRELDHSVQDEEGLWLDRSAGVLSDKGRDWLMLHRMRNKDVPAIRIEHRWRPVARFWAGSSRETRRPEAPREVLAEYGYRYGGGDCGPGTSIITEFSPVGTPRVFELHQRGRGPVATFSLAGAQRLCRPGEKSSYPDGCGWNPRKRVAGLERYAAFAGDQDCYAPKVPFRRDGRYDLQLVAVSPAGQKSEIDERGWILAARRAGQRARPPPRAVEPDVGAVGPRTHALLVSDKRLWVATSEGLFERDQRTGRVIRQFTRRDGLPDPVVLSVAERGGRLWAVTLGGPAYLSEDRFVAVQVQKPDPPGSEEERAWRAVLSFDRQVFPAPGMPGGPTAWRRLLEGAERVFAAVDGDGVLWVGRARSGNLLMRCRPEGCTRLPAWDVGGPTGRQVRLVSADPAGGIWIRSEDFWILDRPRGSQPVPDRALPRGPPGCFRSRLEGVLHRGKGRFRERSLPGLGRRDWLYDMWPLADDRAWILLIDRGDGKAYRLLRVDFGKGRVTATHEIPATPKRYPRPEPGHLQWTASAQDAWVKIGDGLWRVQAKGITKLTGARLPSLTSVTAMASGGPGRLWLATDGGLFELRGGEPARRLGWKARPLDRTADTRVELVVPRPFPGRVLLVRRGGTCVVGWDLARDAGGKWRESGAGRLPPAAFARLLDDLEREGAFRLPSPPFYFQDEELFFRVRLEVGSRGHDFRIFALGDGEPAAYARIVHRLLALREEITPLGKDEDMGHLLERTKPAEKGQEKTRPEPARPQPTKKPEPDLVTAVTLPAEAPPPPQRVDPSVAPVARCEGGKIADVQRHDWMFAPPYRGIGMRILATEDTVYFSAHRFVYALDAGGGRIRWRHDLYDAVTEGPPALVGDTLLVGASGHTSLVALDARTGRRRWFRRHPPRKPDMVQYSNFLPTIALGAGGLAWSLRHDGIRKLDPRTGKVVLNVPGRFGHRHYLVTPRGTILVFYYGKKRGGRQGLVEIDQNGKVLRHLDLGRGAIRDPALAWSGLLPFGRGVVIATESRPESKTFLHTLAGDTRSRILIGTGRWAQSLAVTRDGTLVLAGEGKDLEVHLFALKLAPGPGKEPARPLWRRSAKHGGPVAAVDDRLYVHTDNRIHQLDPATGCTLRRWGTGDHEPYALDFAQPVQAAGSHLFTVTQNGQVVAFPSGE